MLFLSSNIFCCCSFSSIQVRERETGRGERERGKGEFNQVIKHSSTLTSIEFDGFLTSLLLLMLLLLFAMPATTYFRLIVL